MDNERVTQGKESGKFTLLSLLYDYAAGLED
jgi:hypothetical protein